MSSHFAERGLNCVHRNRFHFAFNLIRNGSTKHLKPGPLEVDVVTLDSMCVKFAAPDVIKMDVEGAKYLALQGAERCLAENPIIFLATHSATLAARCSDLLASAGYVSTVVAEDEFVFPRRNA